ncbi:MAG: ECF transporter S component [Clostridiales bacterium]|jgi:uncharacterized membrane protein|nr:ECF transporter S component [Clostridiales bacterium]
MQNSKMQKLALTALFIAVNCASTSIIQIPMSINGYINLGDAFVLLSGWLLGPFYGFLAGGIGSALADIITGYSHYAIATFFIKGTMAIIAPVIFKWLKTLLNKYLQLARIISGIVAEIFMVLAYFGYAAIILGSGLGATVSIVGNLIQGAVGIAVGVILIEIVSKLNLIKDSKTR